VTELDAATGALVQLLAGSGYGFNGPVAVAADGTHVWVADNDGGGGSVTELDAATGGLAQLLTGPKYQLSTPAAIAVAGTRVWVANSGGDSVTEFPASSQ
jgi:DNA-binding beta-propeller fold protein YncE